jgi:hypothetical protein
LPDLTCGTSPRIRAELTDLATIRLRIGAILFAGVVVAQR